MHVLKSLYCSQSLHKVKEFKLEYASEKKEFELAVVQL